MIDVLTDREPVEVLAEEYLERLRLGECPSINEYARAHPEWAGRIRELFPAVAALEGLKAEEAGPSQTLGDLRLLSEIGRGGMGVVYEARRISDDSRVAVKLLPAESSGDPERLRRFRREAKLAASLKHPNIVPVLDVGTEGDSAYMVMPLVRGANLDGVITAMRGLSRRRVARRAARRLAQGGFTRFVRRVAATGVHLAEALAFAHDKGVLHRDIKPANVLLEPEGHVWLADFGIARSSGCTTISRTGDVVGTLCYMAPEQLAGKAEKRSDIYSLGLTLFELVTRSRAFETADPRQLAYRIARGEVPSPREVESRVPAAFDAIIRKATAPDPEDRYSSADELARDLRRFLEGKPVKAGSEGPLRAAIKWARKRPVLLAPVLAGVVSLAVVWALGDEPRADESTAQEAEAPATVSAPEPPPWKPPPWKPRKPHHRPPHRPF